MLSVYSTVYFGNYRYFKSLVQQEEILIEAKEHFIKQTYRNRCEILTANGIQALSIPVIRKNGSKTVIDEVEISYDTDWRKDHWRAIESAYSSSPYFDHYGMEVKELIYSEESNLLKFNNLIQKRILIWLDLSINTKFTSEYLVNDQIADFRNGLNESKSGELKQKSYIQVFGHGPFIPNLSILDAMFCNGPMIRKELFIKTN